MEAGVLPGAAIDMQDGFIHLSALIKSVETAHDTLQVNPDLLLVAFEADRFRARFEMGSRHAGVHCFRISTTRLDPALALWAKALPWNGIAMIFLQDGTS